MDKVLDVVVVRTEPVRENREKDQHPYTKQPAHRELVAHEAAAGVAPQVGAAAGQLLGLDPRRCDLTDIGDLGDLGRGVLAIHLHQSAPPNRMRGSALPYSRSMTRFISCRNTPQKRKTAMIT